MGIISQQMVKIQVGANAKRYYNLGYKVPMTIGKYNKKPCFDKSKTFWVNVLDLPKNSQKYVGCICDCCNKIWTMKMASYSRYNHDGDIFCKTCANRIFNSGENHSRWNSNLTDKDRELRRKLPENQKLSTTVLCRDNYTCYCCRVKSPDDLAVHHLNSYDWDIDGRLDQTNCVTLCGNCHKNFHHLYGYGNNTRQQFEEWIGHAVKQLSIYDGVLPTRNRVYCFETKTLYTDVTQASNDTGCNEFSIYDCCHHKINSTRHYHFILETEYNSMTKKTIK